jgi:hypothetical protein
LEAEAGGFLVEASLGYKVRPCLKKQKQNLNVNSKNFGQSLFSPSIFPFFNFPEGIELNQNKLT